MKKLLLFTLVYCAFTSAFAQITLGPSPYNQDFNSIASGLPTGITVRAGATATALGTPQAYSGAAVAWNNTTGAVKNFASATGLTSTSTSTDQNSSTNRSLGIRQTGSLGDPGGAFVLQLANTSALANFQLVFKLQSLDASSPRLTTWRVDYGFGATPTTFTAAAASGTLTTGGSAFTNNSIFVDFGSSLNNNPNNVWIRIVTLTASTGSGNRASSAIDDISLTYTSGTVATPTFSVNPTSVAFGNQAIGTSSVPQSYTLNYSNLDGSNVVVSTSAPFSVSKSAGGPFSTNISYTSAELSGTSTIIFSEFSPVTTGLATGTITHAGGGVSGSTNVSLSGTGVNLTPVATNDTFAGSFGDVIAGNVSSNDSDPQNLTLTYAKLTDPQAGTLTFNADGTFSYQSISGSASTQTFTYRVTNSINLSADATVTIALAEKSKIFISQYYEGGSVNKWIELTNPTGSPVNTSSPQLKLALYTISGDAGNIVISGAPSQVMSLNITIPAKSSVLIGNTGNSNEVPYLSASSAAQSNNAVINFNGNDGVALLDANNNILDAFGTGVNAKDVSYVRNLDAVTPSAVFNSADWARLTLDIVQNAADLDDPDRLGVHVQPDLPPCARPTSQPTALTFNSVGTKTITLSFADSSNINEYLIVRSLNNSLSAPPVDGTIYNAGNSLGGGTVAGRVGSTSFTDNNLLSGTTFYYFIFALNSIDCDGGPKYLTANPLTGSQATIPLPVCSTPVSQPTNFHVSFSNYNIIEGTFTAAAGADEFLIVMSKDSALHALPVNQTTYAVGDTIGGGIVIKEGVQASFSRSGLAQNTNYFFYIFSENSNCSGGPLYLTSSPLTGRQKTGILNNNNLNFYFGNLHSHSSYSDGNKDDTSKKPEDDYAFAKNSRKMDFLGISEHNHTQAGMRLANWAPGIQAAKNATTPDFVAMHGMEWGVISGGGHVVVYGIDSLIGWESGEYQIFVPKSTYTGPTGLFNIINRHGSNAIATLAHPNTTDFNNASANYDALADSAIVGSALESGPAFSTNVTYSDQASSMNYLSYYNRMLSKGYHLGATMDHDNHNMTFGRHTRARLVVLAPALTENDLLDAIKKMRFYASEDSAAKITYTINDHLVGSVFSGNGKPSISVNSVTTHPVTSITIWRGTPGSGITATPLASSSNGTLSFSDSTLTHLSTAYYYADIVETDGSRIITSPIWYTRNDSLKSEQVITFNALAGKTYGDTDFDPAATSTNASIPIIYTSSDSTIARIVNNHVHILKAGNVNITASQNGNALFKPAATKTQALVIAPKAVTAFADSKTKEYGATDPQLTYTFAPPLVIGDAFTGSLTRTPGENAGAYIIDQGTLALSSNYLLHVDSAIFTITKKGLLIKADDKTRTYNTPNPVFTVTYSGFISGDSSSVLTSAPVVTTTAVQTSPVGVYPITASGATAANYSINYDSGRLTITPASQVITFHALATKTYGDSDFVLTATGGASGNRITYTSSNLNVATIVNDSVAHIVGAGTTFITASQIGNANYTAAADSTQRLIVNKATAIIALSNLTYTFDGTPKSATAITTPIGLSGVTITYNDSTTAPSAVGSYTVVASLNNNNYTATNATGTLTIGKVPQVISFVALPSKTFGDADFVLTATGGASGNPVTFTSSNPSVATIVGSSIHIISAGTTTITASQAGNSTYSAAANATQTLTINKSTATLTLSNLSQSYDGTPKSVTVTTTPSGLTGVSVTYNGSSTAPSLPGSYSVVASLNNTNYTASPVSGTLTIAQPVKVQYKNADSQLADNEGKPYLKIVNTGSTAVPYSELTARYWITPENFTGSLGLWIDYAQLGNNKVILKYVPLTDPRVKAFGYIEYSFTASAGSLAANGNSGEIQSRFANTDWSNFNEANDYSVGTNSSYADNNQITLYRNGALIWGIEPAIEAPVLSLKVFAEAKSSGGSNTISTFVDLRNEGNVAVDFKDITARYWFTSDGASSLHFWIDYAKIGNSAVSGNFVGLSPVRTNANAYLELKVQPSATTFYPLSSTGNIQYRITKNDWSNFNQLNDYSYQVGSMAENSKITIYYKGQLVYGTEPAGGTTTMSTKVEEETISSAPVVYPNPSSGSFTLQMDDQRSGSFKASIYNSVGQVVDTYVGEKTGSFRKDYQLRLTPGMYIMQITSKDHTDHIKIVIE